MGLLYSVTVVPALLVKVMLEKVRKSSENWSFPVLESCKVTLVGPGGMGGVLMAELQPPRKIGETEKSRAMASANV
jgi:hypothetical protein